MHRGFDFGDEGIMAREGTVEGEQLRVGRMAYRVVILPDLVTLRRSTVQLFEHFLDAGGVVLATGSLPIGIAGKEDTAIRRLNARIIKVENTADALSAAVEAACPATVRIDALAGPVEKLWLHQRQVDGRPLLFLVNTSSDTAVEAMIRIAGVAGLDGWDAATGTVSPLGAEQYSNDLVWPLALPPNGSVLLRATTAQHPTGKIRPIRETTINPLPASWTVRRHDPNVLTLDYCRLRTGDGPFGEEIPVIAVKQILQEDAPYAGPITLRFTFHSQCIPSSLFIAIEDPDAVTIHVNSMPVSTSATGYYRDRAFRTLDITALAQVGENTIDIASEFHPAPTNATNLLQLFATSRGPEIESIYLIGDFALQGAVSPRAARPESVRYRPAFTLTEETGATGGDLIADGYPFFAGTMTLYTTITLATLASGQRAVLRLPGLIACVTQVTVNDQDAGTIAWQPYEIDITAQLKAGENTLVLTLTNTLRNLLGSHHRPHIEGEHTWGEIAFSGRYCRETNTGYPYWYRHPIQETDAWTSDYFFVRFGVYAAAEIVCTTA